MYTYVESKHNHNNGDTSPPIMQSETAQSQYTRCLLDAKICRHVTILWAISNPNPLSHSSAKIHMQIDDDRNYPCMCLCYIIFVVIFDQHSNF